MSLCSYNVAELKATSAASNSRGNANLRRPWCSYSFKLSTSENVAGGCQETPTEDVPTSVHTKLYQYVMLWLINATGITAAFNTKGSPRRII
jgi:hypothetical protein